MKKRNSKRVLAWFLLIGLIIILLILTYLKFFSNRDVDVQEKTVNESSSNAIHLALEEITVNFNKNSKVNEYLKDNGIILKAVVNNYSIFISYITDVTVTYEFVYDDLYLITTVDPLEENINKFKTIYTILIEAAQLRINNTDDVSQISKSFLNNNINYDGLLKEKIGDSVKYQMNITKKLN